MASDRGRPTAPRCEGGLHVFSEMALCECGIQGSAPVRVEGREGMVTVYDSLGQYVGCMGVETWHSQISDERLAKIRGLVDEQAEDEGLWGIHPLGQQPIVEAYLQQELRRLHALIEQLTGGV